MVSQCISGSNRVCTNPVRWQPSIHAAYTGLTGLTGSTAHVRAYVPAPSLINASNEKLSRVREHTLITLLTMIKALYRKALRITGLHVLTDNPCYLKVGMKKSSMREQMPMTAAWIDSLRAAFGKDMIDQQIRRGMKGDPVFFASENGHSIGTRLSGSNNQRSGK